MRMGRRLETGRRSESYIYTSTYSQTRTLTDITIQGCFTLCQSFKSNSLKCENLMKDDT